MTDAHDREALAAAVAATSSSGITSPPATDLGTSDGSASTPSPSTSSPPPKKKKEWTPLSPPTPEQVAMQDVMDNCVVKAGLSLVMGAGLGAAFGMFTWSLENAHGVRRSPDLPLVPDCLPVAAGL